MSRDWSDEALAPFAELGEEVAGACCPKCGVRYNDWFIDGRGNRYCWPCWAGIAPEPKWPPYPRTAHGRRLWFILLPALYLALLAYATFGGPS